VHVTLTHWVTDAVRVTVALAFANTRYGAPAGSVAAATGVAAVLVARVTGLAVTVPNSFGAVLTQLAPPEDAIAPIASPALVQLPPTRACTWFALIWLVPTAPFWIFRAPTDPNWSFQFPTELLASFQFETDPFWS
jgi:hypothetical protein